MSGSLFLTGASGYIGSRWLRSLTSLPYRKIICLSRTRPPEMPAHAEFIQGDILDSANYADALAECDTVVHMAAVTGKSRPEEYFRVNCQGTGALVRQAVRSDVKKFLFISTIAAKFQDQRRYYYAQSKRQAEQIVLSSGLRHSIVRPTMVMGKGAPVLESLCRLAALPVIPIFGNGRALVQPVSVEDLSACLVEILEDEAFDNRTVEIGGPQVLTVEELLIKIRRARFGAAAHVLHLPAGLMSASVGMLEKFLLPLLPFTAGQIASFVNDGTAAGDPRTAQWQARMQNVDRMLSFLSRA